MKNSYAIASLALLLLALVFLIGCTQPGGSTGTGTLVLKLTDAKVDGLKALNVTISGIDVHKADANEGEWIAFSNEEKTFDLMQLSGVAELLGEKTLDAGAYTQIRLSVVKADLELDDGTTADVKVPSEKIKIVRPFSIDANGTTQLIIDFKPDSVKEAGGKYIMTPVVKLLTVKEFNEGKNIVGGDADEHGCIGSAGYSWCEARQKCIRIWEEECAVPEPEVANQNAPAVSPQSVIDETVGSARFVAAIKDKAITVAVFKENEDDGNFVAPGQQDNNKANGKDENKSTGNQNQKSENIDLNKMTALNITLGEVSVHLSRSFLKRAGDENKTEGENENETDDDEDEIPDLNESDDQNNSGDLNLNLAENEAEDENAGSYKEQNKWILVSDANKTFDLLQLTTTEALLSDLNIPAGKYTQIRLEILSAKAVIDGNEFDVRVPPNKLMLHGVFNAENGTVAFLLLDFDVGKSLKVTGNNELILRPTIKLTVLEDANVTVQASKIKEKKGKLVEDSEHKFDEEGNED
ncbi:MAG: DUF4382 domain-containing protein [Candidatus Diapherotrites archaeon]